MPASSDIGFGVALVAGLFSFLSPCVLPLVPVYIGYLGGATVADAGASRWRTLAHAGAFVGGFTLVFVALGSLMGLASYLLTLGTGAFGWASQAAAAINRSTPWLARLGGVLLIVLGLHLTGLVHIPFLYRELRFEQARPKGRGLWASVLVGMIFAAGWTPCVGPYLMTILMLASNAGTVGRGALLLAVYSVGLGLPFLLAGLALDAVARQLKQLNRYLGVVSIVGGGLVVIMGVLLVTGRWEWLNGLLLSLWQSPNLG